MADNRNFAALDWLIHEIGETLKEARQALEAYVENPKDAVRIRFCLTHIHQVHGSLQMVEFFGAAMLAEEMERLTQAMIQGSVANAGEAQEVLMRAILQFPVYLDQVKATRKDNPLVVLPLLNDLRAVRGESLLTDTKLFVPNLAPAKKVTGTRSAAAQDNVQFQAMALKLRQMYQYAAAGFIRSVNSDENLAYLQKVFTRLHKLTHGTARHALWDICLALAEALEIDAIEISVAVKNLLRQLDKEIKILAVHGTKALNSYTNDELIKNLLYYVARAGKHAPGFTPNSHLQRIYETYHLDEALIEGKESGDDSANMLSTPDPEAMRSVVEALKTELDIIKHALDVCLSGGDVQTALGEALPVVKRIADTMAVLGLGDLRKQVLEQGAALELMANSGSQLSNEQLMSIAGKVIEIEDALDGLAQQQVASTPNSPMGEGDITLSRAKESVLRESRNGLEHAKDAIIEYIASQWDRAHLQNVPDTLREIRGGLEIMPLPRAARILGACARYIEEQLLANEFTPQWASLDTLADAITSVEYYLERLSGAGNKEENDLLLSVAEESVAALGYAVAKVSRTDSAAEIGSLRKLGDAIHTTPEAAEADEASLAAAYESVLQPEPVVPAQKAPEPESYAYPEADHPVPPKQPQPGNLLNSQAPTIGNSYPRPETTIVVSPGLAQSIGVAIHSVSKPAVTPTPAPVVVDEPEITVIAEENSATPTVEAHSDIEPAIQEQNDLPVSEEPDVETPAVANSTASEDDESDIDDEIIEIFVEEAGEVSEAIGEYFPRWASNFEDQDALLEFRRAFHTLKGSGRMVGANDIGELAWSIENMLNRVLDKTIAPGEPYILIIEKVCSLLPDMIEAFSQHRPNPHPVLSEQYRTLAESLAKGVVPEELQVAAVSQAQPVMDTHEEDDQLNAAELELESDVTEPQVLEPANEILLALVDEDHAEDDEEEVVASFSEPEYNLEPDLLVDDSSDDDDGQLWDIFGAEAASHLQVVEEFIALMEAEAPVYEPPSDSIQRALHTLKGSAHMAEITPIAELAAPLEKFVKELRSYHVVINDDILQLLRDAVSYTHAGLAQIEQGEPVDIPRLQQFVARVNELREIHVAPLVRQQELDENGKRPVDPELLSIFMAEEMNLLLDADKIIAQWQIEPEHTAILTPVIDELCNLNRGAHHAYLPIMANLGEKLEQVYRAITARQLLCNAPLCDHLNSAHIALLDMVDAIAAGQNLAQAPAHIQQALDDLLQQATEQNVATVDTAEYPEPVNGSDEQQATLDSDEYSTDDIPLIEAIYQEDAAQAGLADVAAEMDIDASHLHLEEILADTPIIERVAADIGDDDVAFPVLELDESDSAELDSEEIVLSDITLPDSTSLAVKDELDDIELDIAASILDEALVPVLPVADVPDDAVYPPESAAESAPEILVDEIESGFEFESDEDIILELPSVTPSEDSAASSLAYGIAELPDFIAATELVELDDNADQDLPLLDDVTGQDNEILHDLPILELVVDADELEISEVHELQGIVELAEPADLKDAFELESLSDELNEIELTDALDDEIVIIDEPDHIPTESLVVVDEQGDVDEFASIFKLENAEQSSTDEFNGGVDLDLEDLDLDDIILDSELESADEQKDVSKIYATDVELEQVATAENQEDYELTDSLQDEFIDDVVEDDIGEDSELDTPLPVAFTPTPVAPAPIVPAAPRVVVNTNDDDDFDPEIVEIFIEEALELLEDIERALHEWQEDWNNGNCVEELKRCLHTFKGGARLAGLTDLGDLSHNFETTLIEMSSDAEVDQNFFKQLNSYQDQLHAGVAEARTKLAEGGFDAPQAVAEPEPVVEDVDLPEIYAEVEPEVTESPIFTEEIEPAKPTLVVDNSDKLLAADIANPSGSSGLQQKPNVLTFAPKPKPVSAPLPKIPGSEFGGARQGSTGPAQVQHLATRRAGPQEVVKVSAELLEELVNLAGETSISRSRMEQQVSDLGGAIEEMDSTIHRLQEQLRRLDIETEAQVLFRQEQMMQHEEFDPLEMDRYSQLQQLSRSLIESASDLMDLKYTLADKTRDTETLLLQQSRINTDLQEGLMRSRMVPFSRLVPRLRRIVRQAATELGKEVDFELDNVEGELDRTVLERMVAPLEHMLRNAVDHGIESPEERTAAGKSATGRILLSLGREGGDVMLRLADDGRGINLQRVREKAIERGLMAEDAPLSDQDLMQFILHAGFSTADKVTQISGRGVGMDVVHSEIKQLGGAMFIDSRWGEGTEFTIRLPFTVSVNRALMVQIGDDLYAIPLNTIEGIVRVSPFELEHYYQDPEARFDYAGENYLVRYLGTMLDSDATPKLDGQSLPLPVILVRSTENTVALQVDRLLGSREIVVKTLGAQFSSVRGVSGATVMGDGSVVVILDLLALIREQLALGLSHSILLEPLQVQAPVEEEQGEKTIMVVDDSVTVRKVTGRFLEREGFRVISAKDGVEALQLLQDHIPDAMLLDIEMPRMDGFEVAKNIRTSSRLRDIPIIMITSRTGEKHRDRAFELGVNKYMGKPYQEDLLLANIKELIKKLVK